MDVAEAAASGDHLKLLIATRERLAEVLSDPECPIRDISPLTRRLQEVSKEIATLQEKERQEVRTRDRGKRKADGWDAGSL